VGINDEWGSKSELKRLTLQMQLLNYGLPELLTDNVELHDA